MDDFKHDTIVQAPIGVIMVGFLREEIKGLEETAVRMDHPEFRGVPASEGLRAYKHAVEKRLEILLEQMA